MKFYLRAVTVWLLIIFVENLHGAFRQVVIAPAIGDFNARRIAFFFGLALIFGVAWVAAGWLNAPDRRSLYSAGLLWMALTAGFEVALGRFAMGLGWERIIEDYDITRGGLMGFGLVFLVFAPYLAARTRRILPPR